MERYVSQEQLAQFQNRLMEDEKSTATIQK